MWSKYYRIKIYPSTGSTQYLQYKTTKIINFSSRFLLVPLLSQRQQTNHLATKKLPDIHMHQSRNLDCPYHKS